MNNKHRVFISFQIITLFFSCMAVAMDPSQCQNSPDQKIQQYSEESLKQERKKFKRLLAEISVIFSGGTQSWQNATESTVDKYFPCCVQPPCAEDFTSFVNVCNRMDEKGKLFCKVMERKWLNLPAYPPKLVAEALHQMNLYYLLTFDEANLKADRETKNKGLLATPLAKFSFHHQNITNFFRFIVIMDPEKNIPFFIEVLDELYRLGDVPGCYVIAMTLVNYYDESLKDFKKHTSSNINLDSFNAVYSIKGKMNRGLFEFTVGSSLPSITGLSMWVNFEEGKPVWTDIIISLYQAQKRLEPQYKLHLKIKDESDSSSSDSEDEPDPNKLDPNCTVAQLAYFFINMPQLANPDITDALEILAKDASSHILTKNAAKKLGDMSTADLVCYVEQFGNKETLRKTFLMGLYTGKDIANFLESVVHKVLVLRHLLGVDSGKAKHLLEVSNVLPATSSDIVDEGRKEPVQIGTLESATSSDPVQGKEDLLESDNKSGEHESSSSSENKKNLSTTREHRISSTDKEDKHSPGKTKREKSRSISSMNIPIINPTSKKDVRSTPSKTPSSSTDDIFKRRTTSGGRPGGKVSPRSKVNGVTKIAKQEAVPEFEETSFMFVTKRAPVENPDNIKDFLNDPNNALDNIGSNFKPRASSNTSRLSGNTAAATSLGEIGSNMKRLPKSTNTPKFIEATVPEGDVGSNKKGIASARFADEPITPPVEKVEKFFDGVGSNMKTVKKKDQSTTK